MSLWVLIILTVIHIYTRVVTQTSENYLSYFIIWRRNFTSKYSITRAFSPNYWKKYYYIYEYKFLSFPVRLCGHKIFWYIVENCLENQYLIKFTFPLRSIHFQAGPLLIPAIFKYWQIIDVGNYIFLRFISELFYHLLLNPLYISL